MRSNTRFARLAACVALACWAASLAGCLDQQADPNDPNSMSEPNNPAEPNTPDPAPADGLTAEQRRRADQIVSVFENDTIELQYAYIENINDGRGYTAGRAGFTSATYDMYVVIERYTQQVPDNDLAQYLPRLEQLGEAVSDATDGLEGLPEAWVAATDDPRFIAVQDAIVDELYFLPAEARWKGIGLTTPLSLAALYDAIIQHGEGDDPDGLPAMMDRATQQAGGTPKTGVTEAAWLAAFLQVRRATLQNAFNEETRAAWALGADRPEVFEQLAASGNWNMAGPIQINTDEHTATIP